MPEISRTERLGPVVERFQKTILHEHWRIAFRRQYFTSRRALQTSFDRFLRFYNDDREEQLALPVRF